MADELSPAQVPAFEAALAQLQAELAAAQQPTVRRSPSAAQVGAGQYGLPSLPPLPRGAGGPGLRSTLSPESEALMGALVNAGVSPAIGPALDTTVRLGRATGDAARSFTPMPMVDWAVDRGAALGEAAARDEGSLFPGAQAQTETPEQIMELQRKLQAEGYYSGPIDGRRGSGTADAIRRYQIDAPKREAAEAARRQQELDLARTQGEAEMARARQAEAEAARQAAATAEAQRVADEQSRKLGFERLKEAEAARNPVVRALGDNATALGWLGGGVAGHLARGVVTKFANKLGGDRTARANELLTGPQDLPSRIGRINQFWGEGQPRPLFGQPPQPAFNVESGRIPGFSSNAASAPPATALYQPNRLGNAATDAAVVGAGLGESYVAHNALVAPAEQELAEAYKAVEASPTEANIQRLLAARSSLAIARGGETFGRGTALGYVGSMPVKRRDQSRPDVSRAEAEQIALEEVLAAPKRRGAPSGNIPPPPAGSPPRSAGAAATGQTAAGPQGPSAAGSPSPTVPQQNPSGSSKRTPEGYSRTPWGLREDETGRFGTPPSPKNKLSGTD